MNDTKSEWQHTRRLCTELNTDGAHLSPKIGLHQIDKMRSFPRRIWELLILYKFSNETISFGMEILCPLYRTVLVFAVISAVAQATLPDVDRIQFQRTDPAQIRQKFDGIRSRGTGSGGIRRGFAHVPVGKLSSVQSTVCDVKEYGATGGGEILDTTAIQAAIDACSSTGGGRVRFPPGRYRTATVFVRTGVILDVKKGATIIGSHLQKDYPAESNRWYVILAENATDVGITGGGIVDGQGLKFVTRFDKRKNVMVSWNRTGDCVGDECRPRLIGFLDSQNVHVSNIRLTEPAYWCLHLVRSKNITIHDVSIYGDFNTPNNDGIDIEDSNNTFITRCNIDTGDDAICPKTSRGPLYNLTATNCWIRTKSSAIKLGSASQFNFEGLFFDNITVVDSHRGLALQIRDGGNVNGVTFSNINISTRYYDPSWWGRAEPIYVTACPRDPSTLVGSISNVRFVNITATSENGIFISGSAGSILSKLELANININLRRWTKDMGGFIDYRPGCQGLVHHHTAGVIMEYISDIIMKNVSMTWGQNKIADWNMPMDFRPSTVNKIHVSDFQSAVYK